MSGLLCGSVSVHQRLQQLDAALVGDRPFLRDGHVSVPEDGDADYRLLFEADEALVTAGAAVVPDTSAAVRVRLAEMPTQAGTVVAWAVLPSLFVSFLQNAVE